MRAIHSFETQYSKNGLSIAPCGVPLFVKPGVTVRDVAELLGNTEEMIRKHYGAWVPERQERMTRILREAFDDKPRPKLAVISASTRLSG